MPAPEKGLVFTGARARLMLNGVKIGWATDVSGSEEIQYEPIEVLDNFQVQEHAPIGYTVSLSASRVRIVKQTLKSQGFFPSVGGNSDEHLQNVLSTGDLVLAVEDNQTGDIIAQYEEVRVASHNWQITARGIVMNNVTMVAVRAKDESEI